METNEIKYIEEVKQTIVNKNKLRESFNNWARFLSPEQLDEFLLEICEERNICIDYDLVDFPNTFEWLVRYDHLPTALLLQQNQI